MPSRNWAADARRKTRARVVNEKALASMDPATKIFLDEEEDLFDDRPKCLVCVKPVTPDGDQAHMLTSGSWVHSSCIHGDDTMTEINFSVPEAADTELRIYEIEVEFTKYVRLQVIAHPGDDVRSLIPGADKLDEDISDVSVVVREIDD